MSKDSKPRERLLKFGIGSLTDAELFAILLRTGTKGENVVDMSNRLINEYGLKNILDCSLNELQKIKGIGVSKAMQILVINEIVKRINLSKSSIRFLSSAEKIFEFMHDKLKDEKQENFVAILLNNRNYLIKEELLTKGILDASVIDPREIFKSAIKNSASRIVLVHNHPSGNSEPSKDDLEITKRLIEVGNLMGIKILDHIIVGRDNYWSWKRSINNLE